MSRSAGSARRSGDPRKRAAQEPVPSPTAATGRRVVLAAVAAVAAVVLAWLALVVPSGEEGEPSAGREYAVVACDLTSKAEEAAGVATRARLAAAVLLLDQAVIASARASGTDAGFADLDDAVQAVHTAGHRGDPDQWRAALDTARAACDSATG